MRGFLKQHRLKIIIICILVIFVIPFTIHLMFIIPAPFWFVETQMKPGDILVYAGALLSLAGTVFLGIVALYQNKQMHTLNKQMQQLEQAKMISMISAKRVMIEKGSSKAPKHVNRDMPTIEVIEMEIDGFNSPESYHIDVEFHNGSSYPTNQMEIYAGKNNSNCIFYVIKSFIKKAIYIPAHEIIAVRFVVPSKAFPYLNCYNLSLSLRFTNVFGYHTDARLDLSDLSSLGKKSPFRYHIALYTDVRPKEDPTHD